MRQPRFPQTQAQYLPLKGGLDLVTPPIELDPGRCIDALNYEPMPVGGYRRINGYERFDGRPSPTGASYYTLAVNITGTVAVGDTVAGVTSGATGKVLAITSGTLVLGRVTGTFVAENLQVSGITQAVSLGAASLSGGSSGALDAAYRLLAANDLRGDILVVPGSGQVRGIFELASTIYAFRDNAGATSSDLYKATSSGWTKINYGYELLFKQPQSVVTITIAAPGVVTWNAHGLAAGRAVQFSTTIALPTGITAGTTYYTLNVTANTFQFAATAGGAAITTSGSQSGVHTALVVDATGIKVGDTVTGVSSGASAVARAVLLRTGTWTNSTAGSIVFDTITGTFSDTEALQVSSVTQAQANGASAQIVRLPGGRYEVVLGNFTGSATTRKAYGVDGVNTAFEFDGTRLIPIHTGAAADTPTHVEVHKNKLFLALASSVEYSTTNNPYAWTALTGAAELGMGAAVTGMVSQTANSSGASLAIFTQGRTGVLYGSSSDDFVLAPSVYELGYRPYTIQAVSNNTYGLTARGVHQLITTLNYGDFSFDALSFFVQPLVQSKYASATASVTLRGKNQYRVFFSDNSALVFGLTGDKLSGIMPLDYGRPVRCCWNSVWANGEEHTYFGSDSGYVYEDNVGTSFDGSEIEHWLRPAFNHLQSPRVRKRFRAAVFEASCDGYANIVMNYDLGYANPNVQPGAIEAAVPVLGAGAFWDSQSATWEKFTWDAAIVDEPRLSIDGTENNIGFSLYGNAANEDPVTWQGVNLLFTERHVTR